MFNSNLSAYDLTLLGECVLVLRNAKVWNPANYVANRKEFIALLDKVGFTSTRAAAARIETFNIRQSAGQMFNPDAEALQNMAMAVYDVLRHEASAVTLLATDHTPPPELADLEQRIGRALQPHEKALRDDTIICLKAHLARPAIVMAWALGYELVRQWVATNPNRLDAFNAKIGHTPATDDSALFSISERRVLDACKNAQNALASFNENTHHALVHLLNDRNRFAHANYSEATINRANVFVEKLIETLASPPFV